MPIIFSITLLVLAVLAFLFALVSVLRERPDIAFLLFWVAALLFWFAYNLSVGAALFQSIPS